MLSKTTKSGAEESNLVAGSDTREAGHTYLTSVKPSCLISLTKDRQNDGNSRFSDILLSNEIKREMLRVMAYPNNPAKNSDPAKEPTHFNEAKTSKFREFMSPALIV